MQYAQDNVYNTMRPEHIKTILIKMFALAVMLFSLGYLFVPLDHSKIISGMSTAGAEYTGYRLFGCFLFYSGALYFFDLKGIALVRSAVFAGLIGFVSASYSLITGEYWGLFENKLLDGSKGRNEEMVCASGCFLLIVFCVWFLHAYARELTKMESEGDMESQ